MRLVCEFNCNATLLRGRNTYLELIEFFYIDKDCALVGPFGWTDIEPF